MEQAAGERGRLRTGYTTGACAAAAARAAFSALRRGVFPDPVRICLPGGEQPCFALAEAVRGEGWARAGVIKDAGDDPDITHGVLVRVTVRPLRQGSGIVFRAGEGVGMVTLPGLPVPPGEPAINPGPRQMIREALAAENAGAVPDVEVEIAIPGGERLAARTLNPRLGIVGGLSVLGTTGIVRPYSCGAWIASIQRGIDVARALGLAHVAGCTGRTSEQAVRRLHALPEPALIDMGGFAGGLLKYLRRHPVPRLTLAGGPGKLAKLGQGALDLHSSRARVDMARLAAWARAAGASGELAERVAQARLTSAAVMAAQEAGVDLAGEISRHALATARRVLGKQPVAIDVVVVGRGGEILARAGP
jgi:cobalt-precorrin-5B (C1)-methyltransferase